MPKTKQETPGIQIRNGSTRLTFYKEGNQIKITLPGSASSQNLSIVSSVRIIIQNLWQQNLIQKSDITSDLYERVMLGQGVSSAHFNVLTVKSECISILLTKKLTEYHKMIENNVYSDNKIKESTYNSYRNYIHNTLIPQFGQSRLNELTKLIVVEWINTLKISFKYFRNLLIPLKAIYSDAQALKLIKSEDNIFDDDYIVIYAARILPPGCKPPNPFTDADIALIETQPDSYLKQLLIFGVYTGLRVGELINLRIDKVSLYKGYIEVDTQFSSGLEMSPKTKKGKRKVTIFEKAAQAIIKQLELCRQFGQEEYLFFNPNTGGRWSSSTKLNKHLNKYQIDLKIAKRGFHQCRHMYASMLVKTENLYWIAEQLGHETIELLINVYGSFIPNNKLTNGYEIKNKKLLSVK